MKQQLKDLQAIIEKIGHSPNGNQEPENIRPVIPYKEKAGPNSL